MSIEQPFFWRFRKFSDNINPKIFIMMSRASFDNGDKIITFNRQKNDNGNIEYSSNANEFLCFVENGFPVGLAIFPENGNYQINISFSDYLKVFVNLIEQYPEFINHNLLIDWACIPLISEIKPEHLNITDYNYKAIDTNLSSDLKTVITILVNSILLISDFYFNGKYRSKDALSDTDRGRLLYMCIEAYKNQKKMENYKFNFIKLFSIIQKQLGNNYYPNPFITFLVFSINNNHERNNNLILYFQNFIDYCHDSDSLTMAILDINNRFNEEFSQIPFYHIVHEFSENVSLELIDDPKFKEIMRIRQADSKSLVNTGKKDSSNDQSSDIEHNRNILLSKLESCYCNSLDYFEQLLIRFKNDPLIYIDDAEIKRIIDMKRYCKIMLNQIYKFKRWDDNSLFMLDFAFPTYAHKYQSMFRDDYNIQEILQFVKDSEFTEQKNKEQPPEFTFMGHM